VLTVASGLRAIAERSPTLARRLVVAGSVAVVAAGTYWFVQRVFLAGGA
jgi:hypothetical protein